MSVEVELKLTLYCDEPNCDRSDYFEDSSGCVALSVLKEEALEEGWQAEMSLDSVLTATTKVYPTQEKCKEAVEKALNKLDFSAFFESEVPNE